MPLDYTNIGLIIKLIPIVCWMIEETNDKQNVRVMSTMLSSYLQNPDYLKAVNMMAQSEKYWDRYEQEHKDNE